MTTYTKSSEYEPRPFYAACPKGSTILDCLIYNTFWRRWGDKSPKIFIKSKDLDVCDSCYIFCNYYKSIKKESYEQPYYFIDYDDYDDDDDYDDAV